MKELMVVPFKYPRQRRKLFKLEFFPTREEIKFLIKNKIASGKITEKLFKIIFLLG